MLKKPSAPESMDPSLSSRDTRHDLGHATGSQGDAAAPDARMQALGWETPPHAYCPSIDLSLRLHQRLLIVEIGIRSLGRGYCSTPDEPV